jgi:hypothetical protein
MSDRSSTHLHKRASRWLSQHGLSLYHTSKSACDTLVSPICPTLPEFNTDMQFGEELLSYGFDDSVLNSGYYDGQGSYNTPAALMRTVPSYWTQRNLPEDESLGYVHWRGLKEELDPRAIVSDPLTTTTTTATGDVSTVPGSSPSCASAGSLLPHHQYLHAKFLRAQRQLDDLASSLAEDRKSAKVVRELREASMSCWRVCSRAQTEEWLQCSGREMPGSVLDERTIAGFTEDLDVAKEVFSRGQEALLRVQSRGNVTRAY